MSNKKLICEDLVNRLKYKSFEQIYSRHGNSHRELFSKINKKNAEYFSVILVQQSLKSVITKYCKKVVFTELSLIEAAAKRKAFEQFNGFTWVYSKIKRRFPKLSREEQLIEIDYYIKCLIESLYPETLESYARGYAICKFDKKFNTFSDKQYQNITQKHHSELAKYLKSLFKPVYEYRYFLPSNIPYPLTTGIGVALESQYYFMQDNDIDKNRIYYAIGNYTGSSTREDHGFYGHLFAEIQNRIKPVTAFIVQAEGQDIFKVIRKSDNLILSDVMDLTGNYSINYKLSKKILKNIEIY